MKILLKTLHKLSLKISDLGQMFDSVWLWEKGGNLEFWCDSKIQVNK